MTHAERRKLIERPISIRTYGSGLAWSGSAVSERRPDGRIVGVKGLATLRTLDAEDLAETFTDDIAQ